ncbi:Calcipressin-domain-containing protein [Spinellus fusiger]|nr:Calcipressin-domain-containing protein [Spinellus fusiger]
MAIDMNLITLTHSIATNTLLLPDIPKCLMKCDSSLKSLKVKFEEFGSLSQFIVMKGFGRIMVVYESTAHAMQAKKTMDRETVAWHKETDSDTPHTLVFGQPPDSYLLENSFELRLYYGQHNPIHPDPVSSRLQVPELKRNFLISPPGSPFDDWEQILESPPNKAVLASDLSHALAEQGEDMLEDLDTFQLDGNPNESPIPVSAAPLTGIDSGSQCSTSSSGSYRAMGPKLKIVLGGSMESTEHLPLITVQDWDGETGIDKNMFSMTRSAARPVTRNESLSTTMATSTSFFGAVTRVAPTARPPINSMNV